MRIGSGIVTLLVAMGLAGCGGSASGTSTVPILASPDLDGAVTNEPFALAVGGGPAVGDVDAVFNGRFHRQFFSFDLTGLPPTAVIASATLRVYQGLVLGTPFATHGVIVADHMDYGAALDIGDLLLAPLTPSIGTVSTSVTLGFKTLVVTAAVQADRAAARPRSQFRLRFTTLDTDSDGANDLVQFTDRELSNFGAAPGQEPTLILEITQ